jgi:folate-binding protein YgfZ
LRDFLPLRLGKYIISEDVTLDDVTEETTQYHFLGDCPELPQDCRKVAASRLGEPGWDVWGPAHLQETLGVLAPILSLEETEQRRIEHGIPAWDAELARDILPPEAGLETWTVDYHKGCYIGQEVISRLKSVGKVNRKLVQLGNLAGPGPEVGWLIYPEADPTKACGEVTSAIYHGKLEKVVALGYVRREHLSVGSTFLTGPAPDSLFSRIELRNP